EGQTGDAFGSVVKKGGKQEERFDSLTTKRGRQNAVTVVSAQSKVIRIEEVSTGAALEKPAPGSVPLATPPPAPERLSPDVYIGDSSQRTGFGGLEAFEPIYM